MSQILGLSLSKASVPLIDYNDSADSKPRNFAIIMYEESAPEFRTIKHLVNPQEIFDPSAEHEKNQQSDLYLFKLISSNNQSDSDIPPLVKRYSGNYVSMIFSGDFSHDFNKSIDLGSKPFFVPDNDSKSLFAFYWILEQLHTRGCAKFSDMPWSVFLSHMRLMCANESINILISDGKVLIGFCNDINDPLHYFISSKNEQNAEILAGHLKIDETNIQAETKIVMLSTDVRNESSWVPLQLGQMIVVAEGKIIWDSARENYSSTESAEASELVLSKLAPQKIIRNYASFETALDEQAASYVTRSYDEQKTSIYEVVHESWYGYATPVSNSKHLLRLHPVNDMYQSVSSYKLMCSSMGEYSQFTGVFGNSATVLDITQPYNELKIISHSIVSVSDQPPIPYHLIHEQLMIPLIWMPWDRIMMQAYLTPPELPESELFDLSVYAIEFVRRNNNHILSVLNDINNTIYHDYAYVPHSTTLSTTPYEVFVSRRGVCQDFANLFICLARLLNIPARYRVGYLYTGGNYEGRLPDQTHAWVEVYLPRIGWMGFDPTNGCQVGRSYIRIACGRNYRDATPTSGVVYGGMGETMSSHVQVILLNP